MLSFYLLLTRVSTFFPNSFERIKFPTNRNVYSDILYWIKLIITHALLCLHFTQSKHFGCFHANYLDLSLLLRNLKYVNKLK